MNDRLVTALGALAALAILGGLLFQGQPTQPVSRPTSAETGPNGYAALARWLEGEGVRVVSLRERANVLTGGELGLPPSGNLFITTMPHRNRLRRQEGGALWQWVADGNTLLIMAALDDTPDWVLGVDTSYFLSDLARISGLEFGASPISGDGQPDPIGKAQPVTLDAVSAHPLMQGIATLRGESDYPAGLWAVTHHDDDGQGVVQLARMASTMAPAMWEASYGGGHVIVSGLGSLLSNRVIGERDNRDFVANVLRFHLAPHAAVIIDDMHQGLSALYDPEAFFGDPRLGATLLFVLGLWALYLLGGSSRLAPLAPARSAPRQDDFVAGIGGFLARKLSRPETGRLMVNAWFDELRRRGALPAGGPPWPALAAMPTLQAETVARLRVCHDALSRGEDVDLREVHNTIEELRRMLR